MPQSFLITIWAFTLALSIFRYFEEDICIACFGHGRKIVSFIIGAMIPIIFLELLMDVYKEINTTDKLFALFLPFGFVLSFLIERHIYREKKQKNKKQELHGMYVVVSFIWALFLGVIFATEIQANLYMEILLLVTFCLFHIMGSIYVHHIDQAETNMHSQKLKRLVYGFAPVYGYLLADNFNMPREVTVALLAVFTGIITHTVVDDIMAEERKTVLAPFLAGNILFTFLFAVDIFLL